MGSPLAYEKKIAPRLSVLLHSFLDNTLDRLPSDHRLDVATTSRRIRGIRYVPASRGRLFRRAVSPLEALNVAVAKRNEYRPGGGGAERKKKKKERNV